MDDTAAHVQHSTFPGVDKAAAAIEAVMAAKQALQSLERALDTSSSPEVRELSITDAELRLQWATDSGYAPAGDVLAMLKPDEGRELDVRAATAQLRLLCASSAAQSSDGQG